MKIVFYLSVFICCVLSSTIYGQKEELEKKSNWKGFERVTFQFNGTNVQITKPKKSLPGNPWLWRARFPEYHAAIDSTLLAKGFHVAYVNTDNKFGSPKAVAVWNQFYDFVTDQYNLQEKVALHGHSRGGLFIYNWAKENPEKIACIYGDAVVCDFKSWPAGFGESKGSVNDWKKLKAEYGFESDDVAKSYQNNPIDNLQRLADAKVPILHTISLKDKVVPAEENSLLLVHNYIRLGGTATVSPCNSGVQKSTGHHYQIDDPEMVVDFIIKNSTSKHP